MDIFRKAYYIILDLLQTILLIAAFFLVLYLLIMRPYEVKGNSMHPYLKNKEYVLTNLIIKRFSDFKRGDVVVFQSPADTDKDFIKRIIAIPGDSILIRDGNIFINGEFLDENLYLPPGTYTSSGSFLEEGETLVVPGNRYFVLGDNRSESSDSREWGFVPKENIIGKSFFVYWPPSESKLIKKSLLMTNLKLIRFRSIFFFFG